MSQPVNSEEKGNCRYLREFRELGGGEIESMRAHVPSSVEHVTDERFPRIEHEPHVTAETLVDLGRGPVDQAGAARSGEHRLVTGDVGPRRDVAHDVDAACWDNKDLVVGGVASIDGVGEAPAIYEGH